MTFAPDDLGGGVKAPGSGDVGRPAKRKLAGLATACLPRPRAGQLSGR
jgi:hypothetical protein